MKKTITFNKLFIAMACLFMANTAWAQTNVTVGGNTLTSTSTIINRSWGSGTPTLNANYSIGEILYTNSEIGVSGGAMSIDRVAFNKTGGSTTLSTTPNVSIYMKTVSATTIASGTYNLATYTLVWSGTFPSNGAYGFKEVTLSTTYSYANGANDNLSILVLNNSGSITANNNVDRPGWGCNTFSGTDTRSRFNNDDAALPTFGGSSTTRPQVRLRYTLVPNGVANDNCPGTALTVGAAATNGTVVGATASITPTDYNGYDNDDVWYNFNAPASGNASIRMTQDVNPQPFDGVLELRDNSACNSTRIQARNFSTINGFNNEEMRVSGLTPGANYKVRIYSYGTGTSNQGGFTIRVQDTYSPSQNDNVCSATVFNLSGSTTTVQGNTNTSFGYQVGEPTGVNWGFNFVTHPSVPSQSQWYRFTPTSSGTYTFTGGMIIGGSGLQMGVYRSNTGSPTCSDILNPANRTEVGSGFTSALNGTVSVTNICLSAGVTYYIQLDSDLGELNTPSLTIALSGSAGTAPTAITGTTTICTGTTTTLTATGGNSNTRWYTGSCGGTQVGTGASYTTNNLNATTEFFAANEDGCGGITACASVTVTVNAATAPTGITGITQICAGNTSTLETTGGNVNTKWFTGSCGGTQVGTGTTYTTTALNTTTEFFAANEECGVLSTCATITVNVDPAVTAPTAITGNSSICAGDVTTLTATGGDANTQWFTGSCGGTQVGTGASYTTNALNADTEFFAANSGCGGITTCVNVSVSVLSAPSSVSAISGTDSVCENGTETYSVVNTAGLDYTWTLPNGFTGSSTTNEITVTAGNAGGTLSVVSENSCGSSAASDLVLTVNPLPTVTLDAFALACTLDAPFNLTGGSPAGGTYTVDNVTATTFTPATGAGVYVIAYEFTDANNCFGSATQNLQVDVCSGINDIESANLLIYPNPANNQLMVKLNAGNYKVAVLDALGKQVAVYNWQLDSNNTSVINTTSFAAGIYQLKVQAENGFSNNVKFIVSH